MSDAAKLKKNVEFLVLIDGDGNVETGTDYDEVMERWRENVGDSEVGPRRLVKVVLTIPLPTAAEIKGEVPAESFPNVNLVTADQQ